MVVKLLLLLLLLVVGLTSCAGRRKHYHTHRYRDTYSRLDKPLGYYVNITADPEAQILPSSQTARLQKCWIPIPAFTQPTVGKWYRDDAGHFAFQLDKCAMRRLTGPQATECLKGKRIVFMGDSVTRYQITSLMHFLACGQYQQPYDDFKLSVSNKYQWRSWTVYYEGAAHLLERLTAGKGHVTCDCQHGEGSLPHEVWSFYMDGQDGEQEEHGRYQHSEGEGAEAAATDAEARAARQAGRAAQALDLEFFYLYKFPTFKRAGKEGIAWAFNEELPPFQRKRRRKHSQGQGEGNATQADALPLDAKQAIEAHVDAQQQQQQQQQGDAAQEQTLDDAAALQQQQQQIANNTQQQAGDAAGGQQQQQTHGGAQGAAGQIEGAASESGQVKDANGEGDIQEGEMQGDVEQGGEGQEDASDVSAHHDLRWARKLRGTIIGPSLTSTSPSAAAAAAGEAAAAAAAAAAATPAAGSAASRRLQRHRRAWRPPDVLVFNMGIFWWSEMGESVDVVMDDLFSYVGRLAKQHGTRVIWKTTTDPLWDMTPDPADPSEPRSMNERVAEIAKTHGMEVYDVGAVVRAAAEQRLQFRWSNSSAHFLPVMYEQFNDLLLNGLCEMEDVLRAPADPSTGRDGR